MNEITSQLWISDIESVREDPKARRFDVVITVCQDPVCDNVNPSRYYWFNMADGEDKGYGGECTYDIFEKAASALLEALKAEDKALIHCHAGRSRSPTVAIAALAVLNNWTWWRSYTEISEARKCNPNVKLEEFSRVFIEEHRQ